jgi:hypothetical protein
LGDPPDIITNVAQPNDNKTPPKTQDKNIVPESLLRFWFDRITSPLKIASGEYEKGAEGGVV